MIFFRVLIALASGEFDAGTYQFYEPPTGTPFVCIMREAPIDMLSGPHPTNEARCLDAQGILIYVGYVREVSDI